MKRQLVGLLFIALLAACRPGAGSSMVAIPPPDGWEPILLQGRGAKDDYFLKSPESPLLAEDREGFRGLDYWGPDPAYHFAGDIRYLAEPEAMTMVTTAGSARPCERVGWISFSLSGKLQTLQVYRLQDVEPQAGGEGLFLPFNDATSGRETYPAGRYVELQGPRGGPFVLDFNRAYNPSCAYGEPERFACPVTPASNRLPVPIEAGERGFLHGS